LAAAKVPTIRRLLRLSTRGVASAFCEPPWDKYIALQIEMKVQINTSMLFNKLDKKLR